MITLIVCMKRRPGMSREEFSRYWRERHAPLVQSCTDFSRHLLGYVQHHMVDQGSPAAAMFGVSGDYDGVAMLSFASTESMAAAFSEPRYLAEVRPDEPAFIDVDNCLSFVVEPHVIVPKNDALFELSGKIALVTGGARGIGAMISRALVERGVDVLIAGRSEEGPAFAAGLPGPGTATFLEHDLATIEGVEACVADIASRAPKLHILVNNAGAFSGGAIEAADPAQWDRELGLNLRAPFFLTQKLLPNLLAASVPDDPARVVNIGSIAALWGKSNGGAYAYGASKAAIHHLTRMLAADLTARGVTVNAIAPGYFPSDMTDGFFAAVPGLKDQVIASIPAGRLGTPQDVAGAVTYLCSRAGAYVSGAVIPLEGAAWQA